ncbi:hypothetical protein [Desulfitobacterium sp. AusDCA]|uniref:hypothetical protein n=1 Tax=Desulfitobacterium sp. AusDCA TaxID=3240383 RepID=UPI003DA6EAB4
MKFGGNMNRSQGFGQAAPQGLPVQPQMGPGAGLGYPGNGMMPGQGFPQGGMNPGNGMAPNPMGMMNSGFAPSPGGSIRNNLGAGLKSRGVFQKDGQINNLRGGFIGPKQGGAMGGGPFSFLGQGGEGQAINQPRQLILEPAQAGLAANGIATISPDNVFTCIANLPAPNTLFEQGYNTYAAYLVDQGGKTGFLAGVLRPVGNGVYQTQFRSQVPLSHYSRVLITVENPQRLGHVPNGPIILQVKPPSGPSRFLNPVKKAGGSVWNKITGFIRGRGKAPMVPPVTVPQETVPLEGLPSSGVLDPVNPLNSAPVELPGAQSVPSYVPPTAP